MASCVAPDYSLMVLGLPGADNEESGYGSGGGEVARSETRRRLAGSRLALSPSRASQSLRGRPTSLRAGRPRASLGPSDIPGGSRCGGDLITEVLLQTEAPGCPHVLRRPPVVLEVAEVRPALRAVVVVHTTSLLSRSFGAGKAVGEPRKDLEQEARTQTTAV